MTSQDPIADVQADFDAHVRGLQDAIGAEMARL
ncbi:MAG: hypothetical protein ACI9MR_002423, partial [Myxococcota bacterium]